MEIGNFTPKEIQERMAIAQDTLEDKAANEIPRGWKRVYSTNRESKLTENGLFAAVYAREEDGREKFIISFRGYDTPKDIDDLYACAQTMPQQMKDAYRFTKKMVQKYDIPPDEIEILGHSMGGYLAKTVGLMIKASRVLSISSPGLKREDFASLRKLAKIEFGENATDITKKRLDDTVTSIYSLEDWVPRVNSPRLHGKKLGLHTTEHHHSLHTLEAAFLKKLAADSPQEALEPKVPALADAGPMRVLKSFTKF